MAKLRSCRGLTAVVTGASSGIGEATARLLAREGAQVALVGRRAERLDAIATTIGRAGGTAIVSACDVGDRKAVAAAAADIAARIGPVDILVNSAGYGRHRRLLDWDLDDIEAMNRVNYLGSVYWTKALLPGMVARRRGWIVFVSSVAGKIGVPGETAYVATKFALVGFAESLSFEVERSGVHVMTVCPGTVDTEFYDEAMRASIPPPGRRTMVGPDVVAEAILRGLARGAHEITVPRGLAVGYLARTLAPPLLRWGVRRSVPGAARGSRPGRRDEPGGGWPAS
jgi:hypothetical protein